MPRLPEPRTPALKHLASQLRFQPAEASRRQLARAEELALQLLREHDPERQWPVEWVVFRITAYRADEPGPELSGMISGSALQRDLAALIQRLSSAAGQAESSLLKSAPGTWLTVQQLCARWRVSRQTLDRYRTLGLFSRRARSQRTAGGGRAAPEKSLFHTDVIRAFENSHQGLLTAATGFSRIAPALAEQLHRRARRYHRTLGCSLTQIALRLAKRFHRSAGAVRRTILSIDSALESPCFPARRSLRASGKAEIIRDFKRGGRVRDLTRAAGRSRASVYRMVASERARRLRALALTGPARADFTTPAATKLLLAPAATEGLGRPLPRTLGELTEAAAQSEPAAPRELALAGAYALLRFQAAQAIDHLGNRPTILGGAKPASPGIDWIETRLRWAARLKAELVRSQLGLLLRTVESHLQLPLTALPGAGAADLVAVLAAAIFEAADRHDPFKGGRLAAPAGLALNRAAARWAEVHARGLISAPAAARNLARAAPSHARLDHVWIGITPWTAWLEPPPGAREKIDALKGRPRAVIIARLGWDARPPRTIVEAAAELAITPQAVIRAERAAMRELL